MTTITIGRSSKNTIVVDSTYSTVSGNHATIIEQNGVLTLQDHSTNGTYINGQYVHNQSAVIREGDIITLARQYVLTWNEIMRCLGHTHATQRFQSSPHTARVASYRDAQFAQQINLNVGAQQKNDMVNTRETPKCLNSWNWGAFLLGWIWGIGNGVYWPLITLIPYIGQIASLIIIFILGANGSRYAWDKFNGTAEEFDAKQKSWTKAGVIVLVACILLGFLIVISIAASF